MSYFTSEQIDKYFEVIENIADWNDRKYNYTKLAEECNELSMLLLQCANKKEDHWPDVADIQHELADVRLRMNVLIKAEDWDNEVRDKHYAKLLKLQEYIDEGKYKGGV